MTLPKPYTHLALTDMTQLQEQAGGQPKKITVYLDDSTPHQKKGLKCMICGKTFMEYYTSISMIIPGEPDSTKAPHIVQCNGVVSLTTKDGTSINTRCKTKYFVC